MLNAVINQTNIISPRVPLIDERTGLMAREWYRFFLNLFILTGSGTNDTSLLDLQLGPPVADLSGLNQETIGLAAYAELSSLQSQVAELQKQFEASALTSTSSDLAEVFNQLQALALVPSNAGSTATVTSTAPQTNTADFTVADTDVWLINNKSGSTCVVTLPLAASWIGRSLTFKTLQAQLVNSASSNVVPIGATAAGTAILLNVVGNWVTMVSDGTNWVIMQAT